MREAAYSFLELTKPRFISSNQKLRFSPLTLHPFFGLLLPDQQAVPPIGAVPIAQPGAAFPPRSRVRIGGPPPSRAPLCPGGRPSRGADPGSGARNQQREDPRRIDRSGCASPGLGPAIGVGLDDPGLAGDAEGLHVAFDLGGHAEIAPRPARPARPRLRASRPTAPVPAKRS